MFTRGNKQARPAGRLETHATSLINLNDDDAYMYDILKDPIQSVVQAGGNVDRGCRHVYMCRPTRRWRQQHTAQSPGKRAGTCGVQAKLASGLSGRQPFLWDLSFYVEVLQFLRPLAVLATQ